MKKATNSMRTSRRRRKNNIICKSFTLILMSTTTIQGQAFMITPSLTTSLKKFQQQMVQKTIDLDQCRTRVSYHSTCNHGNLLKRKIYSSRLYDTNIKLEVYSPADDDVEKINDDEKQTIHNDKISRKKDDLSSKINLDENKLRLLRHLQGQQQTSSLSGITSTSSGTDGLSRYYRGILTSASNRQRFVTGTYPLYVSVRDSPTRKWLGKSSSRKRGNAARFLPLDDGTGEGLWKLQKHQKEFQQKGMATSQLYINNTIVERSLASFEKYGWLENTDTSGNSESGTPNWNNKISELNCLSLEMIAEIQMRKPGYLNLLPKHISNPDRKKLGGNNGLSSWFINLQQQRQKEENFNDDDNNVDMLWVTDFSLTRKGRVTSVDTRSGKIRQLGKMSGIFSEIGRTNNNEDEVNDKVGISFGWPNEVDLVPTQIFSPPKKNDEEAQRIINHQPIQEFDNALLVADGFLVPGRENGGIYVVRNLGQDNMESKVCLTGGDVTFTYSSSESSFVTEKDSEWFYHRAVWVDLTGDGRKSILTARAKRPSILNVNNPETGTASTMEISSDLSGMNGETGQLVWLECPKPHRYDEETGTPLDIDDTVFDPFSARHIPWKLRVLDEGPDVMFSIADLDNSDDTIEVIASQFFGKRISLHSIQIGNRNTNYLPKVVFRRILDDSCGSSFSSILANLEPNNMENQHDGNIPCRVVVDSGSTIDTLKTGDVFTHVLVTSHECSYANSDNNGIEDENESYKFTKTNFTHSQSNMPEESSLPETDGGSLFVYRVPSNWKSDVWRRTVIATGFRVRGKLSNMINPGAPGFCYAFYPRIKSPGEMQTRPYIAVSGDCAEAAYIFSPVDNNDDKYGSICCVNSNGCNVGKQYKTDGQYEECTKYSLMCEITCGATVGSLAIGYDNLCEAQGQKEEYAKIYIPCFEKDKVLVFAFGNGEEE